MLDYEIVEDEWAPEIGDKVRVLRYTFDPSIAKTVMKIMSKTKYIGIIRQIRERWIYVSDSNDCLWIFYEDELERLDKNVRI